MLIKYFGIINPNNIDLNYTTHDTNIHELAQTYSLLSRP